MAWNSIHLQLQVTDPRSVSSEHQHRSSPPNTGVHSNSRLQGRSLREPRHTADRTARKTFTTKKALLIACGVRCVLSPRPSNCSTSSAHKDPTDRPRSSSARIQTSSRGAAETQGELKLWDVYNVMKRTEERKRARSGIYRQRVPPDSPLRPSTVPLENQMGHRPLSTPEIPMCKILWRRKDDQHVLEDGSQHYSEDNNPNLTPLLHLYLPSSYQSQEQGEDTSADQDNSISKVNEKNDITVESQKQDITDNKTEDERRNDFTDDICCDIADTWQSDIPQDSEETFMEKRHPQDDNTQRETMEIQSDFGKPFDTTEDYGIMEKAEGIYRRTKSTRSLYKVSDIKLSSKTRCPASATVLTFPSSSIYRNPSPALSVLPSFYGTSFGIRIRTTSESKTRTRKASDDNRFTQPSNDTRHSIEIKGNPCLLRTRAGAPNPKIMSTERGSQAHKVKTTKTFLWG